MNLAFEPGVSAGSGESAEEIICSDILRIDISSPEVLASITPRTRVVMIQS